MRARVVVRLDGRLVTEAAAALEPGVVAGLLPEVGTDAAAVPLPSRSVPTELPDGLPFSAAVVLM
jgi:hypothetical protein